VTEIKLSEAINELLEARFDSEYYKKEFMEIDRHLKTKPYIFFEKFTSSIKKGIFDLPPSNYLEKGVPLVRTSEIKDPLIDFSQSVFISEERNQENFKTSLKPLDLVFTKIGAYIGDVAILPKKFKSYNISQNVAGASIRDKSLSSYLLFFLKSKYGQKQLHRSVMLSGQGKLDLSQIKNLKVVQPSKDLVDICNQVLILTIKLINSARAYYIQAEELLLSELGLNDWQPIADTIAVKRFSDSWGGCDRGDAEYYQPKFEQAEAAIKNAGFPVVKLGSLIEPIQNGFDFREFTEEGTPYIRVGDVKQGHIDIEGSAKVPITQADVNKPVDLRLGDILFTRKGSFGNSAVVTEREAHGIISSEIMLLRLKVSKFKILPNYISLFLNSKFGYLQVERRVHGVAYYSISQPDLADLTIPVLPFTLQEKIVENIIESFQLKAKSKQLLEIAKTAVERAIEEDEERAIDWMNQQLTNLGINQLNN